jgi:hypothetical protein
MPKPLHIIRWILVPLSAVLGWYIAFFIALAILNYAGNFCPPELVSSGTCMAKWYSKAENIIINIGAGLGAVLVVLLPTLIAPAYRSSVAAIAYVAGTLAALWLGFGLLGMIRFSPSSWASALPVIVSLVAGLITVFVLRKWLRYKL